MPKLSPTDNKQVTQHIQKLAPAIRDVIETLRHVNFKHRQQHCRADQRNNPSFYYTGEMAPFDPKEYKRDIAVMNLHNNRIMLVFPSGAKVNDCSGLLVGDYKDGRRLAIFKDLEGQNYRLAKCNKAMVGFGREVAQTPLF